MRSPTGNAWLRASFWLYLVALAGLGFRWLSPLSPINEQAIISDVLVAAAAGAWLVGLALEPRLPRLRSFHLALALFVAATALSAAFAVDKQLGFENLLLTLELVAIALLTSYFASDRERLRWIVWAVCFVSLYTGVLAIVALGLFYADVDTDLTSVYGGYFAPSEDYARIRAGFALSPLLGSFCIFASAVVARDDVELPRGLRLVTQVVLAMLVVVSLSRALLGFVAALIIRAAARRPGSRAWKLAAIASVAGIVLLSPGSRLRSSAAIPTEPSSLSFEVPDPHNRRETIETAWHTLAETPVVGEGPGSLPGENSGEPARAHLTPLNVAATLGLPAFVALVFMIAAALAQPEPPDAGCDLERHRRPRHRRARASDVEHFRHVWAMLGLADADRSRDPEREARSMTRRAT